MYFQGVGCKPRSQSFQRAGVNLMYNNVSLRLLAGCRVGIHRQPGGDRVGVGAAPAVAEEEADAAAAGGTGALREGEVGRTRGGEADHHAALVVLAQAQSQKTSFNLKALIYFSVSKLETGCFQSRVKLAPPPHLVL